MSYAMSLGGSHRSATAVRGRNPFTGEMAEYHTYTLTPAERAAASAVLARHGVREREDGDLEVTLSSGQVLALARGEDDALYLYGDAAVTDAALAFVFELASAANYVIGDDLGSGATSEEVVRRTDPVEGAVLVRSVEELRARIRSGWAAAG